MLRLVAFSVALALSQAPGQPATQTAPQTPNRGPARPGRPNEPPPKGTAIIKGTIVAADTGTPLRKVQVRANAPDIRAGGVTSTGADGHFEIKELPAGRYTLTASKGAYVTMSFGQKRPGEPGTLIELVDGQLAEKVNFSMVRGGVIAGRIVDDAGEAMAGVNVSAMRYQFMAGSRRLVPTGNGDRTDDRGEYRIYGLGPGEYYVNAQGGFGAGNIVVSTSGSNTEETSYAPTYYPGTPNIAEAQRVTIKAGQESLGIHFAVTPSRLAFVRGRVVNSRGEAARGMVMMVPADNGAFGYSMGPGNMVGPDGSFQLANVAPGRYNVTVRPMGSQAPDAEFAILPITVGSDDVDNVMLTTNVGATARGIVQTDDGAAPPFHPEDLQIFAQTMEPVMMTVGGGPPKLNPDFTFELSSLFDRRLLRGSIANSIGWFLKAVYFEGDDVIDTGIDFVPGRAYEGIQLVFTQKTTELSGIVTDSRGKALVDASVVVFPANREHWGYQSRYLRTARPDTEGRYNIKSLPPGEDYLVIAVQGLENGQGGDPEFLARAREEAKSLTLNEGEKKAVDVKLSTLVP